LAFKRERERERETETRIILVMMAAAMGGRYVGVNLPDPMGTDGKIRKAYVVYDDILSGFSKIVFIIRHLVFKS
jgi:hypothetical protein